jgi:hypothetical protein
MCTLCLDILHDLTQLDDALDLLNNNRADAHCERPKSVVRKQAKGYEYALSLRMRESFR